MWMKVVRMMRVLRHGLFSLAFAVLFVAVALLSGHGGVTGESRPTLAADAAAAQPYPDRVASAPLSRRRWCATRACRRTSPAGCP